MSFLKAVEREREREREGERGRKTARHCMLEEGADKRRCNLLELVFQCEAYWRKQTPSPDIDLQTLIHH
jgi:hypothetical protein